jgi:hypothetical protein
VSYLIQIVGMSADPLGIARSPFDGQFLVEYDPARDGVDPLGRPMVAHLVTSPSRAAALRFTDPTDAFELWRSVDPRDPVRPDGRPNRPLTAFTITVVPEEE